MLKLFSWQHSGVADRCFIVSVFSYGKLSKFASVVSIPLPLILMCRKEAATATTVYCRVTIFANLDVKEAWHVLSFHFLLLFIKYIYLKLPLRPLYSFYVLFRAMSCYTLACTNSLAKLLLQTIFLGCTAIYVPLFTFWGSSRSLQDVLGSLAVVVRSQQ